jgi:hypothetical protein
MRGRVPSIPVCSPLRGGSLGVHGVVFPSYRHLHGIGPWGLNRLLSHSNALVDQLCISLSSSALEVGDGGLVETAECHSSGGRCSDTFGSASTESCEATRDTALFAIPAQRGYLITLLDRVVSN